MRQLKKILAVVALVFWSLSASPAMAQAGKALDDNGLKAMLDGMGYEPKALSHGFLIDLKQDTWDVYIQLVLSPNNTKLGMNSNLGKLDDLDAVPAKRWLDLLESNADVDPSSFYVDREQKKLYMHRVLDNNGVTPALLRGQIESFAKNVKDTQGLWSFN